MHRTAWISVGFALLQACSQPAPTPLPAPLPEQESSLMDRLVGHWVHEEPDSDYRFEEHWAMMGDGSLKGIGIVRAGNDTMMIEHLDILSTDSGTWYSARIPTENGGEPVFFRMDQDTDSLVFTNALHDYPQRIVYVPGSAEGWQVRVNGIRNGTDAEEHLHFVRMKDPL